MTVPGRFSVRQAMHLANANALVWAIGNGLVSTTLVVYLALELGAQGIAVSLILAAPRFVGLLRLASPGLMTDGTRRKRTCLAGYFCSGAVLLLLPVLTAPRSSGFDNTTGIWALVVCWSVYHLLEYVATIALWSWLGDWMPARVRGRLIGWRERWLVGGRIVGIGSSVSLAATWTYLDPSAARWQPLAWSATVGALLMIVAVAPLALLPALEPRERRTSGSTTDGLWQAFASRSYRRLLAYSCWLAIANGITGTAQSMYPLRVLGIHYTQLVGLRSMMFAGQTALAPVAGRWIDRRGTRGMLAGAQLLVATGPLFFLLARPQQSWWIVGAFVVWMAYAAVNVGLDNLKLKLAPTDTAGPSLAVYYALGDLASGISLVAAGTWYDVLAAGGSQALRAYAALFAAGWCCRTFAAWLAWRIPDD